MKKYGFIEIPTVTYNSKEQELSNKQPDECELVELVKKVKSYSIESYREAIPSGDFREDNKIWTEITMYSGDSFIANMTLAEFEKLLTNHLEDL
jgi:hypothetical protein